MQDKRVVRVGLYLCLLLTLASGCQSDRGTYKPTLHFIEDQQIEYEKQINTCTLIDRIDDDVVTSDMIEDDKIYSRNIEVQCPKPDSKKIGKQTIIFKSNGYEYPFTIMVEDKTAPTITAPKELRVKKGSSPDFNKSITVSDNIDKDLKFELKGKYDTRKPGTYDLTINVTDKAGNKATKQLKLIVEEVKQQTKPNSEDQNSNKSNKNNTSSNRHQDSYKSTENTQPSSDSITRDFLFSSGYDMASAPAACQTALIDSGRSGTCTPLSKDGLLIGMRLHLK